jgi:hypothetical protein
LAKEAAIVPDFIIRKEKMDDLGARVVNEL